MGDMSNRKHQRDCKVFSICICTCGVVANNELRTRIASLEADNERLRLTIKDALDIIDSFHLMLFEHNEYGAPLESYSVLLKVESAMRADGSGGGGDG